MNEELKNKLNEMSLSLIEQIQNGAAWAGEQTNLFVQELVLLHILENSIQFIGLLILSIAFALAALFLKRESKKHEGDDQVGCYFGMAASLIICLATLVLNIITNGVDICKGIWAPRIVIVEKLKGLL